MCFNYTTTEMTRHVNYISPCNSDTNNTNYRYNNLCIIIVNAVLIFNGHCQNKK